MAELPGFDVLLRRLADHRKLDLRLVAQQAEIDDFTLRSLLEGAPSDAAFLRRLAPALGFHGADLFAMAGAPVPEDLAPLDATAAPLIPSLVKRTAELSPERRSEVIRFVRALPQEARTVPVRFLRLSGQDPPGFGAVLVHMLANRNLYWTGAVHVMHTLSGLYVSAATIGGVGGGTVELTHDLLADFAVVLGISVGDLAAMAGPVAETDGRLGTRIPRHRGAGYETAALLTELRRLSADQIRRVGLEAGA
ncbi:hypothetical protein OTB20_36880 [Streptomyces sp. H27-H1]|uniref:hypothetical protein n=1 Tax=Streptomyces sp. H27-H1 TaxID=2996461 RepID=UPI002271B278|nr:hypothetical protein [Streptomyces sp. H27-H1]MCY0931662.1 hypothetical protein [Streptomyces sp. H27-H1]